jgi:hypothetical protein
MSALAPLESLYEVDCGPDLPLPPDLASIYGRLQLPLHLGRPYVIGETRVSVPRGSHAAHLTRPQVAVVCHTTAVVVGLECPVSVIL